jgi:hypothetical protein
MYRKLLVALVLTAVVGRTAGADPGNDFEKKPVQALETLARLKHLSTGRQALSADEMALIADAQKGQLDKLSFAEAALIASGITDREKRKAYLVRLDKIEAGAREALAGATTPAQKGERLLGYLHAGPMKPGYSWDPSSLPGLLDTGKYNCLSSAVLYNVIGRRLGLDLRGMVQPGHAFSILYDGKRPYEVQTTCARGFDPKDPTVQKELETKTGIKPSASRTNCREIGEVALLSVICSNRTAELVKDNRYYEVLLIGFLGLALDPTNQTAVDNTHAAWTKWTKDLIDQGQFEKVMAVAAVGRELAPKDPGLLCNRQAAWERWIEATHARGGEEASRSLIRRLWKENGKDRDFQSVVRNHVVRTMHQSLKSAKEARDFKATLAVIDRHRVFLQDESEARYMSHPVYDTWAQPFIKAGKWAEAIEVYQGAVAVYPGDAHLSQNLEYCRQESKKQAGKK